MGEKSIANGRLNQRFVLGLCIVATLLALGQSRADDPNPDSRSGIQKPSLFDEVRTAIQKLKSGTSWDEAARALKLDKLVRGEELTDKTVDGQSANTDMTFTFPRNSSQRLTVTNVRWGTKKTIFRANLYDGDRVVAKLDGEE